MSHLYVLRAHILTLTFFNSMNFIFIEKCEYKLINILRYCTINVPNILLWTLKTRTFTNGYKRNTM